jgi:hypothetical protein
MDREAFLLEVQRRGGEGDAATVSRGESRDCPRFS